MEKILIDPSEFPIVRVKYLNIERTQQEYEEFLDAMDEYFYSGKPWAMLADHRESWPNVLERKAVEDRAKVHGDEVQALLRAIAVLQTSRFAAGVLTALGWIFGGKIKMRGFADEEAATTWLREQLLVVNDSSAVF